MNNVSIIVPVFEEGKNINHFLEKTLSTFGDKILEIILVDGSKTGTTVDHVKITDTKIKKILSSKGRAVQMNRGAAVARGEVLIFLHADTELPEGAIDTVNSAIIKKNCPAGAFGLEIISQNIILKFVALTTTLRSRITRMPYGDQAQFFRREFFDLIGGYKEMPLMEDVEIMQRIKKRKVRICILKEKVKTSARRWIKEGILYTTLRNKLLITMFLCGISPEKLLLMYKPHKNANDE